ncbi:transcription factor BIM2-like [Andrographis paniculata]|uniref:transcription factor BIM2-like n=1 Tax=Andrographis paniculata TaxID=175694 RepID=UPI0021E78915|nr:transcription factor BIM2-like [Andrographis paniculata]
MNFGKGNHEEEEEEDEEFGSRKDAAASNNSARDVKNGDKANAIRSKHSVTEQRRRSKINERFQILRDLIPHSDQKRDTASFLLEVIQYVQFLQENVQKYESSCQPWSSEPTKLMPWRNNHWRVQSFSGQPQPMKNSSGIVTTIPATFDENNNPSFPASIQHPCQPNLVESAPVGVAPCRSMDPQTENPPQGCMSVPSTTDGAFPQSISRPAASKRQSAEYPTAAPLNVADELTIEGGTISISSVYSQGLLNSLTRALESTGVDLSQANVSVQINLGKRANGGSNPNISIPKDQDMAVHSGNHRPFQDLNNSEDFDPSQKRMKL